MTAEHAGLFDSPRAVARFLCGVSSPKTGRARLAKHELFGCLAEVPFSEVMAWAGESAVAAEPAS